MSGLRGGVMVMPPKPRPSMLGLSPRMPGLEVHPGAERAARPGQHADPQAVVGVELVGGRRQGAGGRAVERVP